MGLEITAKYRIECDTCRKVESAEGNNTFRRGQWFRELEAAGWYVQASRGDFCSRECRAKKYE